MQIHITWDASADNAPPGFQAAVQAAVSYFDSAISTPINVNIQFSYGQINGQALDSSAVGESISNGLDITYAQVLDALTASATSADDAAAIASLPWTDPTNGGQFFVNLAEAKALGLYPANAAGLDGYVALSDSVSFTFDPNNREVPGLYDAIGVLEHEISEVLGRMSELGQTTNGSTPEYSPLDLFRYSGGGVRDLNPDAAYFSLDGRTMLSAFNDETLNGGDAGDWASSVSGDAFDAFVSQGQEASVSATDLRVLDVLGYSLADSSAPASLTASAPSAALVEAGVTPSGEATPGVATSTVDLTPSGGDFPTYVLSGWTALGSGLYSQTGTYGSVVLDTVHNTLTYTLNNSAPATLHLGVGVTATDTFTVAIADEFTTASATVRFSVTGTDIDPTVIGHTFSTGEGTPLVESDAALLSGSEDLKGASLFVSGVGDATHGSVVLDGHGNAVFTPDAGYAGPASYAYTVSDGHGGTATASVQVHVVTASVQVHVASPADLGDFDGDGKSDVLWRNSTIGEVGMWASSKGINPSSYQPLGEVDLSWQIAGVGDFDGDGKADVLWRNTNSGEVGAWESSLGSGSSSFADFGNVGLDWTIAGVGDFDGDGKADVLWRNTNSGDVGLWESSKGVGSSSFVDFGSVGSDWRIAGVGDFDGDGKSDVLWRNTTTGDVTEWLSSRGGGASSYVDLGTVALDWTIAGVGDFDGDGKSDVLWRNTVTGHVGVWESSKGSGSSSFVDLGSVTLDWTIIGVGDYDGDGKSDILWRNSNTGQVGAWESSRGVGVSSFVALGNVSSPWRTQT